MPRLTCIPAFLRSGAADGALDHLVLHGRRQEAEALGVAADTHHDIPVQLGVRPCLLQVLDVQRIDLQGRAALADEAADQRRQDAGIGPAEGQGQVADEGIVEARQIQAAQDSQGIGDRPLGRLGRGDAPRQDRAGTASVGGRAGFLSHLDIKLMGGSQWFSITYDCAYYIDKHASEYKQLFCSAFCADEFYLQSIVGNSAFYEKRHKPTEGDSCHGNMRLIEWIDGAHPKVFSTNDINRIMNTDLLFARKFDELIDEQAIDMIVERIVND